MNAARIPSARRTAALLLVGLLLWAAAAAGADSSEGYLQVTGPCGLEFPRDHGPHPGFRTEWWYYTGNLVTETGRRLGFQLTFFRHQLTPFGASADWPTPPSAWRTRQLYLAHAAVSDISGKRHLQSEQAGREALGMAGWVQNGDEMRVFVRDWSAVILPDRHRLEASADGFSFQLELAPAKGPVRHGIDGYSRKGSTAERASCYYSLTRLETTGTVTLADRQPIAVTGTSWMDHEFSTAPLEAGTVGWDWFSVQLADRSEFMIYLLRREDGSLAPASSGTYVDPLGVPRHLERGRFEIDVLDSWKSKRTGAVYPSVWRVKIPLAGVEVVVSSSLPDQEMRPADPGGISYWEGSVAAKGTKGGAAIEGQGYVELTGYARPLEELQ
ncbi:MAG TPA: lipocalin-like domain-containing protein [Desulfobacterales bacterium]|nr:lipocalin-like domain-containing protein [Desulfobacterales bacterium]